MKVSSLSERNANEGKDEIELELEDRLFGNDRAFHNDLNNYQDFKPGFKFKAGTTEATGESDDDLDFQHLEDADVRYTSSFLWNSV